MRYAVTIAYRGSLTYYVEADNDNAAIEKAQTRWERGDSDDDVMRNSEDIDGFTTEKVS